MRIVVFFAILALVACVQAGRATDGYIKDLATGKSYRVVYNGQVWKAAQEVCQNEGGKLAVPKSQDEFLFIQKLVRGMYYPDIVNTSYRLLAWVGVNNLDDYRVWKNVDGEEIEKTGFHQWSGNNGNGFSDNIAEPHCGGIDAANPGLRDWWCHRPQPFICERPPQEQ